jgi:Family of unknown function (DUF5678)
MDYAAFTKESNRNRDAFEGLRTLIRRDYAGQYVALANGKLIGSAPTFDEARALIDGLVPVPEYYVVFPADDEPDFEVVYDLAGSV